MQNNKNKQQKVKQAIELLNTEMKTKYPKGSIIVFSGSCIKEEKLTTVSCSWYNKVGGEPSQENIVSKPAEWQNIPYEEAEKISEMFDKSQCVYIHYV